MHETKWQSQKPSQDFEKHSNLPTVLFLKDALNDQKQECFSFLSVNPCAEVILWIIWLCCLFLLLID